MPEWLSYSLEFTLIGLMIVFTALIIVALSITFINFLDRNWQEREKRHREAAAKKTPSIDTTTLVLIAAAVATMLRGRFHIRKIQRLLPRDAKSSPWSLEGRVILHGSHVVPKKR
ncbi:MAG: OadG family protein [candidate division Zixibacteria bacterium]|nr:OadG family protein [candidate division Zixibacteria bacterium]MDD5425827.1 OadG family protein [candidate division Zixibacteria bacterium]